MAGKAGGQSWNTGDSGAAGGAGAAAAGVAAHLSLPRLDPANFHLTVVSGPI
jgi:hypothetical protein